MLIWRARETLTHNPKALLIFVKCVDWRDKHKQLEAHRLLSKWVPSAHQEDVLEVSPLEEHFSWKMCPKC